MADAPETAVDFELADEAGELSDAAITALAALLLEIDGQQSTEAAQ